MGSLLPEDMTLCRDRVTRSTISNVMSYDPPITRNELENTLGVTEIMLLVVVLIFLGIFEILVFDQKCFYAVSITIWGI